MNYYVQNHIHIFFIIEDFIYLGISGFSNQSKTFTHFTYPMLKSFIKKLLWPPHLWKAFTAKKRRKKVARSAEDPQLKLYDKILNTGFLHYGYFDDPKKSAGDISLNDIRHAQIRYAELILDQISNIKDDILDVGCGMGGLIGLLLEKNIPTTGVTPDRVQVNYISEKYPQATLIHAKFQKMPVSEYEQFFSTIVHSESLQYMGLNKAIEKVLTLLKPGGRWIVVDYFRTDEAHEKSGHYWNDFVQKLEDNNLEIVYKQDITANIRPTLDYIYMWGNEIGKPIFEFIVAKLERKHPGKHYLLEETIAALDHKIEDNLDIVNPDIFTKDKNYILVSIERKAG
ncbi:MAG: methyltransferase domain-containing protein [Calditrichaeota bacterium]|nr:MAG: methyltransferase domain-containing protein [Calditrichota bacterium]MBL1205310.1 methyltransferase domain-containing protein [Calditrichota bacterium]NOG45139.1 methyltransferase domain-containing protein [Calditrichota bacterium]